MPPRAAVDDIPVSVRILLRRNLPLAGDTVLAVRQFEKILGTKVRPEDTPATSPRSSVQQKEFIATASLSRAIAVARYAAFVEKVIIDVKGAPPALTELIYSRFSPFVACDERSSGLTITFVSPFALMEASGVIASRLPLCQELGPLIEDLLRAWLSPNHALPPRLRQFADAARTNSYLGHGIHVYKAKFFPRMVRSIICSYWAEADFAPIRVLDNFVGSGTTLLEARLLGLDSTGVDIDPLSCFISEAKMRLAEADAQEMVEVVEAVRSAGTGQLPLFGPLEATKEKDNEWPDWLNRRIDAHELQSMRHDIRFIKSLIRHTGPATQRVLLTCLSDAITRKLKMRFLGIGVGRFALELHRCSIADLFCKTASQQVQTIRSIDWFKQSGVYPQTLAAVLQSDARHLPFEDASFDLVVTSPPYLPASSGRENYVRSKAAALISLGIMTRDEVDKLDRALVGSTTTHNNTMPEEYLPRHAKELLCWLASDKLKTIKYQPTAEYFRDMWLSFRETLRVLRPSGRAVFVVSKQSQFYEYRSRQPTFTARTAEILAEIAEQAGLSVVELYDVELDKRLAVARPRSLDPYYETVIVLRSPS